jgi:ketosteroid isomerase-like protein
MHTLILLLLFATAVPPAPVDAVAEKEVLAAMDAWKQAMMKKDRGALEKVFHDELSYGHSNGLTETKAQAVQHVVSSRADYAAIDLADATVRVYGNFALVTGKVNMRQVSDGKPTDVKLSVLHVWVKSPEGWKMLARQSTRPAP